MTSRGTALGATLLGAALSAVVALPIWVRGTVDDPVLGHRAASAIGQVAAPAALPLGLLALAAVVVAAVTGRVGRVVAGLLAAAAGLGSAWFAVGVLRDADAVLARTVAGSVGRSGVAPVSGVTLTVWPWLALLGGVLVALGGFVIVRGGPRWSGANARYESPARSVSAGSAGANDAPTAEPAVEPADGVSSGSPGSTGDPARPPEPPVQPQPEPRRRAVQDWDSLSRGEDPTA